MVAQPAILSSEPPRDAFEAVLVSARQLPFAEQARLVMALLPTILPAIEAARQGVTVPEVAGTAESLRALIASWEVAPADDDPAWDEIWRNVGIESGGTGR